MLTMIGRSYVAMTMIVCNEFNDKDGCVTKILKTAANIDCYFNIMVNVMQIMMQIMMQIR